MMQGFQAGLRIQELRSQEAMRRLQERQVAQRVQLEMEQNNLAIQYRADMEKALRQTQLETSPVVPVPGSPFGVMPNPNPISEDRALLKNVAPVLGKYQPDKLAPFVQDVATMRYRQQFEPEMSVMTDPVTGEQRTVFRSGRGSARLVPPSVEQRQQRQFSRQEMAKMVDWVRDKAPRLMGRLTRDAEGNMVVPDDIIPLVSEAAEITTETRTDVEKQSRAADIGLMELDKARKAVESTPQAFGVKGIVGEKVEQVRSQFGSTKTPITEARHQAAVTFVNIAKSLRVDSGNMSRYELNQLESIGDITGWESTPDIALTKVANLENALIAKQLRTGKSTNKRVDESLLRRIKSSEVAGLVRENLLSVEDAVRWHQLKK